MLTRRLGHRKIPRLVAVFLVGAALHLAYYGSYVQNDLHAIEPATDSAIYVSQARQIRDGEIRPEVFYRAPLYPFLLSLAVKEDGTVRIHAVILVQLALGLGTVFLLSDLANHWAGDRAGLLTALMGLLYAPLAFYGTKFLPTSLGLFLGVASWSCFNKAEFGERLRDWMGGALLVTATVLCIPSYLIVALLLPVLLVFHRRRDLHQVALPLVFLVLVPVACLLASSLAAKILVGEWILLGSNSGITFAQGNQPGARGAMTLVPGMSATAGTQSSEDRALASKTLGSEVTRTEANSFWWQQTFRSFQDHPWEHAAVWIRKARLMMSSQELGSCYLLEVDRRFSPVLKFAFLPAGWILAWAVVGWFLVLRRRQRTATILAMGTGSILSLLVFYVNTRYRMPLMSVALVLAGVGMDHFFQSWRHPRRTTAILCLFSVAGVLSVPALSPVSRKEQAAGDATYWSNLSICAGLTGHDRLRVEAEFQKALAQRRSQPSQPHGHLTLARAYQARGELQEAISCFRQALDADPTSEVAAFELGAVYNHVGRDSEAWIVLREGLRHHPESLLLQFSYGATSWNLGKRDEAEEWLLRYQARVPEDPRPQQILESPRPASTRDCAGETTGVDHHRESRMR